MNVRTVVYKAVLKRAPCSPVRQQTETLLTTPNVVKLLPEAWLSLPPTCDTRQI
jgi:hypothetical protein